VNTAAVQIIPEIKRAVASLEGSDVIARLAALERLQKAALNQLHSPIVELGALPLLKDILEEAFSSGRLKDNKELFMAASILGNIAYPEKLTPKLVEADLVPPAVRLVSIMEKSLFRKDLVSLLFSISESVWLRDTITQFVRSEFPPEDLGATGKFNLGIESDPYDLEEKTFWQELLKNTELTSAMYFPGRKAFWDANDFPQLKILEDNWEVIREEALEAIQQFLVAWPEKNICEKGWNVFPFKAFDNRLERMCAIAPRTSEILDTIPDVTTSLFSTLQPKIHIKPHVGYYQYSEKILRVHLGLVIPPGCVLKVNGEERGWEEGKVIVFDDTFRHEAWNPSDKTRIVLMFDILCEIDEDLRSPDFISLSKQRGTLFGTDALISSDLLHAFSTLGGATEQVQLRPEDR